MITSNSFWRFLRNSKPSPMCTLTLGCWKPMLMPGKYFLETRTTAWGSQYIVANGDGAVYLVDVAEDGLLDGLVLDDLAEDTTVTTTDNQDLLGVGVGVHGQVGDHLLVAAIVRRWSGRGG